MVHNERQHSKQHTGDLPGFIGASSRRAVGGAMAAPPLPERNMSDLEKNKVTCKQDCDYFSAFKFWLYDFSQSS